MKKGLLVIVICLLWTPAVSGQTGASINGFVRDATSGETLLLANIVLAGTQIGAATNTAGYYTMTGLNPGTYTLYCSYIGYQEQHIDVTLVDGQNLRLDIDLEPVGYFIDEVTVTADREMGEETRRIGVSQLQIEAIKQLPTILEPDVFRTLQLLPGVKAASDYSSGLYIRGGGPDQTLILLDRTTVYNPTHFFGFFSTFNPDAIKDVRLYKGGYPAEYGGRLGAVVDVYNKDGNRRETQGSLSIGLLASRANVEGPYQKGSWMFAMRRSTLEPMLAVLNAQDIEGIPDVFYFYDFNGKLNYDATSDDRLSLAFYAGTDNIRLNFLEDATFKLKYGNRTVSTNWTHIFSQRLFSNFTLTSSRYSSQPEGSFGGTQFGILNRVYDTSVKGDFEYIPNDRFATKAGFWAGNFILHYRTSFDNLETFRERLQTFYASMYIQETYRPSSRWQVLGGVRGDFFGEGDYVRLEPRLSVEFRPLAHMRLQAGYGRYYQFLSLITSEVFSGFDTWLTTGKGVPPSYGDQFVGGIKTGLNASLNLDVEFYYRTMRALFELDPFLPDNAGMTYREFFRYGEGYAFGTEFLLQKTRGRVNGFIGYTIGKTRRRFPNVNEYQYYIPKYDRLHDLNVVVNFDLSRSWRFTSVFQFATGQAYTEPISQYKMPYYPFGGGEQDALVTEYNNARLPTYHRLDIGASKRGRFFKFAEYELQLHVINVYNRRNIWFYFFEFLDDNTIERTEIPQIPIPIPNVSFTLRF